VAKFLRGIFTGSAGVGETQPEIEGRNLYVWIEVQKMWCWNGRKYDKLDVQHWRRVSLLFMIFMNETYIWGELLNVFF
jgi:hypothetical protein